MTADDEAQIGDLLRVFALATDRAVPREMAALMCADEAESFLDNVANPDADEPVDTDSDPVGVLGVRVFGDIALARFTRPYFGGKDQTLVCRREGGRWTVCADAEDELSLEQLDDDVRVASEDATAVIRRVHALRRQPIGSLTTADIRILLSHNEGLSHLLPRAAVQLQWDPLLQGDLGPGDLLVAVLGIDEEYWSKDPVSLTRIRLAIDKLGEIRDDNVHDVPADEVWDRAAAFVADHP
ncbi:contact-dependent growth inhibition system immunity protein [Mycobacterium sp.]|uniref:contact-dependent growth inhibition system immunity protein n=1 Tax=Mycobacterium sp. TaxID=1785 RepID=UPI003C72A585